MTPRASAIIIVFNGAPYLGEAIESVIAQSIRDWELIVADDGSTDDSLAIAKSFAAKDDRIRVIRHPDGGNHGMSATRNLGVAESRGPVVGFLDCDDVWLPGKLAEQLDLLDRHPEALLIYGRTLIWKSWETGREADDFYYPLGVAVDQVHRPPRLVELLIENRAQSPTTCNAMMRRELIQKVGGFEPRFRGMFEDQVFFSKALLEAPAYVSDRSWAKYRQHSESFSTRITKPAERKARLDYLLWLVGYALRSGLPGSAFGSLLFRALLAQTWDTFRPRRPAAWRRA
jgi:glycosyltransferase involved in cell wall biosynthesis